MPHSAEKIPAAAIREMQKNGAGFAGFATHLDMTPAHPDMFAVPDPDSLVQLPWKPEVGWLASDLFSQLQETNMTTHRRLTEGENTDLELDPDTLEHLRGLGYVN